MATRNERRKAAKNRMLDKLSLRLIREDAKQVGIQRDKVNKIVKSNLADGLRPTLTERAWKGYVNSVAIVSGDR